MGSWPVWVWLDGGSRDNAYGVEAPQDAGRADLLDAVLDYLNGDVDDAALTPEVRARLEAEFYYIPLFSVVTRDLEWLDADLGSFHSEGSGKRVKHAWFVPYESVRKVLR